MDLARIEQVGVVQTIGVRLLALHQWLYERSSGRVGHRILGVPCLLLHTTGAKTGRPRVSGLVYGRDGDDYLVVASNGGADRNPSWYHNLRAHPETEIQIGTRTLPVTARACLPDEPDYERYWDIVNAVNHNRYRGYQRATARSIPVIVLTPRVAHTEHVQ